MENKGCLWIIAIFVAIVLIVNCNDKKSETATTSGLNATYSSTNSNSNSYSTSSIPREKTETEKLLEQYEGNSLRNGSQPYSSFYGSNSTYGNSEIIVNASSIQDVVVIIKRDNSNGSVVRHAYIAKGCSYTFHLPAGTYQPFFYGGDSWCPTKRMSGGAKGGFLRNETFSKDYPQQLPDYTQLSYSLTSTVHGNFSTKGSSESEIF